ncbi:MAG: dienelactone hydrolase family protein [Gammaproteobacteria bacterium]|nr:dienelactone hydrolase family protein [Gammaproteobacteria bacterium]
MRSAPNRLASEDISEESHIVTVDGRDIRLVMRSAVDAASGMTVVLAHGAGTGIDSPFMRYFGEAMARAGHLSVAFDFAYMHAGRKAPDPASRMVATWSGVLQWLRQRPEVQADNLVIGGKSMGGRMASLCVAEGEAVSGLLLLGYPLHASGKPEKVRVAHFPKLDCPCLFIQGDRDALCSLDALRPALDGIPGPATLHVIEGGDHSFGLLKRSGREPEQALDEARRVALAWLDGLLVGLQ